TRSRKGDWWLLQDLDSKARAKATQEWCAANLPHFIPATDYPARSPELNAIENIWAWMEPRVELAGLKSRQELVDFVTSLWEQVPQKVVRNCVSAIPKRLDAVIAAEGGHI